jgi:signal transduction histidine kinase
LQHLLDKLVLLGLSALLLFSQPSDFGMILALLGAISLSALCSYFDGRLPLVLSLFYLAGCCFYAGALPFLPLFGYDLAGQRPWPVRLLWLIPLLRHITGNPLLLGTVFLLSGTAMLLRYRTDSQQRTRQALHEMEDNTKEQSLQLMQKNRALLEKQDYEIRLATLSERNRIAREIHDNVGHLLTRSILQISAAQIVHASDQSLNSELGSIKETLTDAMDSVRQSVHDLHDESIDLQVQLQSLADGFDFCPVKLRFDAGALPQEIRVTFLAITREALSNIARHSNATEASVTVLEHPALYQLIIRDNGTRLPQQHSGGIGLSSMRERAESLGGILRAGMEHGFQIFVSIPKEKISP